MTRIISHRGNLTGPGSQCEREHVEAALAAEYDVEVDVRDVAGVLWVGHDEPLYVLPEEWIERPLALRMWFHAKDETAYWALQRHQMSMVTQRCVRAFMQDDEPPMACVSTGGGWWHPKKNVTMFDVFDDLRNFIILDVAGHPQPVVETVLAYESEKRPLAICTDWCEEWKRYLGT